MSIIKDKKKLLITLGCSHTEGVGCWIDGTPAELQNKVGGDEWRYWYRLSHNNFHEKGWPKELGKLMGYDEVLNLGWGGASASSNVKHWFETYQEEYFEDYEVTMVWLLPDTSRISFYTKGILTDEMVNGGNNESLLSWLKKSNDIHLDLELEQSGWIKIMQNECKYKGIRLILFSQEREIKYLKMLVNQKIIDSGLSVINTNTRYRSKVCGHLNEKGYKIFAKTLYQKIKSNFRDIDLGEYNDNIKSHWNGERYRIDSKQIINQYNETRKYI